MCVSRSSEIASERNADCRLLSRASNSHCNAKKRFRAASAVADLSYFGLHWWTVALRGVASLAKGKEPLLNWGISVRRF